MQFAILENGKLVETSPIQMHLWLSDRNNRRIEFTQLDGVFVLTQFMGINHGTPEDPKWFETVAVNEFEDNELIEQRRYGTLGQAKNGHAEMLESVKARMEFGEIRTWKHLEPSRLAKVLFLASMAVAFIVVFAVCAMAMFGLYSAIERFSG